MSQEPGAFGRWFGDRAIESGQANLIELHPLLVSINGRSLLLQRMGIAAPALDTVDIVLHLGPGELPPSLAPLRIQDLVRGTQLRLVDTPSITPEDVTIDALWNLAFSEICPGCESTGIAKRTAFGTVALFDRRPEDTSTAVRGLSAMHLVATTRNSVFAYVEDSDDLTDECFFGYVSLGVHGGRSRHLRNRLTREFREHFSDPRSFERLRTQPWAALHRTLDLRRRAMVTRQTLFLADDFFGDGDLHALATKVHDSTGITSLERESLEATIADVEALSNGLLAIALDESQSRFSWFGLLFGATAVLFAAVAMIDFGRTENTSLRWWVYGALIATGAVFVVTMATYRARRRLISRRRSV
jgi:hypothetical protein